MKKLVRAFFIMGLLFTNVLLASVYNNTATVVIKAGQERAYFAAANQFNIVQETLKEPGNISYLLNTYPSFPRLVTFSEVWKSKSDLDKHLQTPHMAAFFKSINFDPALYDVTVSGNAVTFVPKSGFYNYVIEMLKLEGSEK